MPARDVSVTVDGLAQLRRDLRHIEPGAVREIRDVLKSSAELVAHAARADAPRKTGNLADSIRATTSGARGVVRSALPYANVQHWGGTIAPKGTPIKIKGTLFVSRHVERLTDRIVDELGDGIERVAARNGWKL
jgi:phage gpG-like protein